MNSDSYTSAKLRDGDTGGEGGGLDIDRGLGVHEASGLAARKGGSSQSLPLLALLFIVIDEPFLVGIRILDGLDLPLNVVKYFVLDPEQ